MRPASWYVSPNADGGFRIPWTEKWSVIVRKSWLVLLGVTGVMGCGEVTEDGGGPVVFAASDVRVIGTTESIAEVVDLEVLPDGRVWILNSVTPFFVAFGPEGDVIAEHGAEGGGPQEFGAPAGFVAGGLDGEVWVIDGRKHVLVEVSRPERRSEIAIPRRTFAPGTIMGGRDLTAPGVRIARLGGEVVLPRTSRTLADGILSFWRSNWGADLLALDPVTRAVRPVVSLGEVLGDPTPHLAVTDKFPLWFRLWTVCGDRLRVYDRIGNQIRTFDGQGVELEATPLPPVEVENVTHRQFARAVMSLLMAERLGEVGGRVSAADSARILNEIVGEAEDDPNDLATLLPRYVDLRCADDGTLWIQPFDIDVGGLRGGPGWLRISPDGESREVDLPTRFDAYRFTGGRIWGVMRDDFDVASVAWIGAPALN